MGAARLIDVAADRHLPVPGAWRRWSDLTGVERVGLYTRQSLYVVLWAFNGSVLLAAAVDLEDTAETAALLGGGLVVTALGFATLLAVVRRRLPWRRVALLLVVSGVYVAVATSWPEPARDAAVMVVAASVILPLGGLPDHRIVLALVVASGLLFGVTGGALAGVAGGVIFAVAFVFTSRVTLWLYGVVTELDEARQAQAQLAVVEERLRFSRDVHDVLGRRLSTIAVQAELAATLAARGDERAADRMLDVRAVAHEALREARELARGYRTTDFATELEGARSLLRSAGIEVRLDVEAIPRAWQEAAGWVVRESVTNVLRHSDAGLVEIAFAGGQLTVDNDGVKPGGAADGSGLRGLRERLAPLGASLTAQADGGDRWTVQAQLPGSGPLSATTQAREDR